MIVKRTGKNAGRATQKLCCTKRAKPVVMVDTTVNGRLLISGSTAAAKWLGMRQQDFYRIVKKLLRPPPRVAAYQAKIDKVKAAYPELFKNGAAK